MPHFIRSHGLEDYDAHDYQEAKAIINGYRRADAGEYDFEEESETYGRGSDADVAEGETYPANDAEQDLGSDGELCCGVGADEEDAMGPETGSGYGYGGGGVVDGADYADDDEMLGPGKEEGYGEEVFVDDEDMYADEEGGYVDHENVHADDGDVETAYEEDTGEEYYDGGFGEDEDEGDDDDDYQQYMLVVGRALWTRADWTRLRWYRCISESIGRPL